MGMSEIMELIGSEDQRELDAVDEAADVKRRPGRPRMTASERESIMRLAMITSMTHEIEDGLSRRSPGIRGLKRDLAMLRGKSAAMLERVLATVPTAQLKSLDQQMRTSSYVIGVRRPVETGARDNKGYGIWISWEQLAVFVRAMDDHCLVCDKRGQEIQQCELKKALDLLGVDSVSHEHGCGYWTAEMR